MDPELHCPALVIDVPVAENHWKGTAVQAIPLSWTFGYMPGATEIQSTSRRLVAGNERSEPYHSHITLKQDLNTDWRSSDVAVFSLAPDNLYRISVICNQSAPSDIVKYQIHGRAPAETENLEEL